MSLCFLLLAAWLPPPSSYNGVGQPCAFVRDEPVEPVILAGVTKQKPLKLGEARPCG